MQITIDVQIAHVLAGIIALLVLYLTSQLLFSVGTPKISGYRHSDSTWGLVTGASDGIGYELVVQLSEKGFNVILHGRNKAKVDNLLIKLQTRFPERKFRPWILDASDRSSHSLIKTFVEDLVRDDVHLSVLINNVGISVFEGTNFRPLAEVPESHIAKLIDVNAVFPTQLTHALLPLLTSRPSALILNLGSAAGVFPAIYTSIYGACKAYQFHLIRILRNELRAEKQTHVEVMSVLIGIVQSAGTKEFVEKPSMFAPSSARYAKAIVDSVGCGSLSFPSLKIHDISERVPRVVRHSWLFRVHSTASERT